MKKRSRVKSPGIMLKLACFALLTASNVHAATIISSNTGLTSPGTMLDFTEIAVADNSVLTNQFNSLGVDFTGMFFNGCPGSCANALPSGADPDIGNFNNSNTSSFTSSSSIIFSSAVDGAAFNWASNLNPFTFSAYLGATLVEQFSVNVASTTINGVDGWGFYGFDGIVFDRIDISSTEAFLIDNLEFNNTVVPVPAAALLFGSGLIGLVGVTRRKTNKF